MFIIVTLLSPSNDPGRRCPITSCILQMRKIEIQRSHRTAMAECCWNRGSMGFRVTLARAPSLTDSKVRLLHLSVPQFLYL